MKWGCALFEQLLNPSENVDRITCGAVFSEAVLRVGNQVIRMGGDSVLEHAGQELILYIEEGDWSVSGWVRGVARAFKNVDHVGMLPVWRNLARLPGRVDACEHGFSHFQV